MKLKLSQLSHNTIILVERYDEFTKVYYADGHSEILSNQMQFYLKQRKSKQGYKNPIMMGMIKLYPTLGERNQDCCWINLDYLEQRNSFYISLLEEKKLIKASQKMYLKHKAQQIVI